MDLPEKIGRYEIVHPLGQGGMGRVLLAKDSVLGRHVAVKILRDDLGLPPEQRDALFVRMRHEARAAAALSHPNMVTLHDMGEEPSVGLFLVFEYVDGPTLRDAIGRGPVEALHVARMARELGSALGHAHEEGVIHRDVKPENVLLAKTCAKLADFGIARLPDSTLTQAGSVLGTAAYSAPEALALGEFSAASDQFSLASTLYEALSGNRAFPGDDVLAVATRIATEEPAGIVSGRGLDARQLSRVNAVLARGMAKDARKRFSSCSELGNALADSIEQDVLAPDASFGAPEPATTTGRISLSFMSKKTRRLQNIVAGGGVLVIIGLLLLGRSSNGPAASLQDAANSFEASVATPHPPASGKKSKPEGRPGPPATIPYGARDAGEVTDPGPEPKDGGGAGDAAAPSRDAAPDVKL